MSNSKCFGLIVWKLNASIELLSQRSSSAHRITSTTTSPAWSQKCNLTVLVSGRSWSELVHTVIHVWRLHQNLSEHCNNKSLHCKQWCLLFVLSRASGECVGGKVWVTQGYDSRIGNRLCGLPPQYASYQHRDAHRDLGSHWRYVHVFLSSCFCLCVVVLGEGVVSVDGCF